MYKENYLKSFFKSFGIIPICATVLILVLAAYVGADGTLVNESLSDIVSGAAMAGMGLAVILGLSGLKNEKIGFTDFIRFAGAISSIVMAIAVFVEDQSGYGIVYIVLAAVSIIELICRFIFCKEANEDSSFKNYFANLAGAYNPLIMLLLGTVLAVVLVILAKQNISDKMDFDIRDYKYLAVGAAVAVGIVMIISSIDKEATVSLLDFVLVIFFITCTFGEVYVLGSGQVQGNSANATLLIILMGQFASAASLVVRGVFYNGAKAYKGSTKKLKIYFTSVYEKYDITLYIGLAFVAIFIVLAGASEIYGNPGFMINKLFDDKIKVMVANIVYTIVVLGFIISTLIFRKFKSKDVVRVDSSLTGILFLGAFGTFYGVSELAFSEFTFTDETANIILFAVSAIALLYGIVLQVIRLKSFDQTAIYDEVLTQRQEEALAKQEEAEAEAKAEEEAKEEQKEPENNDPFALTEEDEALFNSYYGDEAKEEEPQEEVVEEEVQEEAEEPQEEVVEEEVQEETEEPQQEEVQEEVEEPQEETEAEEVEEADDAEEDEAEDADEADEYEEEAADDVEPVVLEEHKEKGIVVNDFQIVDEDGNPRKIKRRFLTKMMFAPYETKEYYNEIKNYLTMYRCKGRQSARCESFRYKGLVAKVALGGKSIKVFLALDPSFIDENPKYHLKDVSNKKQYQEVPVMIKVRSQRGLKYFKELVDIMFAQRAVKPKRNFEKADYLPTLIPNGEAILATLGMETYYLQDSMNVKGIPAEMPDNLEEYIPLFPGDDLGEEEVEAAVYLDTLCNHFEDGDQVTIDVLKSLHIVNKGNVLRIKARGTLDRKLIIYAEYFDEDALKMLMCTNCTAIKIYR